MSRLERKSRKLWTGAGVLAAALALAAIASAEESASQVPRAKGLGDPGTLKAVRVEPSVADKGITIRGRDARQQALRDGRILQRTTPRPDAKRHVHRPAGRHHCRR